LDEMTVQVELSDKAKMNRTTDVLELERRIEEKLKAVLGIRAKVEVVNPGTLQRFEGKAKRVIDRRKI